MMAAPSLVRVTPDHLALIRALITAGQTTRALELLDSVWHPTSPEEQCWYLRLWVLVEEGRVIEALELARGAVRELPGSAATSYLLAALEQAHGTPAQARQALERAQLLAPEEQWTPQLAALLDPEAPVKAW
jgi:tetratricopeptide (TPR) repeat protein